MHENVSGITLIVVFGGGSWELQLPARASASDGSGSSLMVSDVLGVLLPDFLRWEENSQTKTG